MNRIRVATLSFAHYHANFWSEVFRDSPRAEFIGVWDDDRARGEDAAKRYATRYWADLDALLEQVDAVAVTSETVKHRPLIERTAARGKHVLCEKPIATTRADADAIAQAVERAGVTFMQSFPKRFDPVNHELKRLHAEGSFGRVWLARVRHGHRYWFDPSFRDGWWTDPVLAGGGALLDEGVHGADFLRWMFGDPQSVTAFVSHANFNLPVEDAALAAFRWQDGMIGEIATGSAFQAADVSIEIFGTKGSAVLAGVDLGSKDLTESAYLRLYSADQAERRWEVSPIVPRFKTGNFHQQNALAFLDSLAEGRTPPIGIEDGRRALAMILSAYDAARSGATQTIRYRGSNE
jgi:predicted dehydrogenase